VNTVFEWPPVDPNGTHAIYVETAPTNYQEQVLGNTGQKILKDPKNPDDKILCLTLKAMPVPMEWPMEFYT
jgi:hypothetical protein